MRFRRKKISRFEPLNRSRRRESALTLLWIRWSGLTSAATRFMVKRKTRDERSNEMGLFRKRKPAPKSNPRPGTRSQSRYLDASCSSRNSIYSTPRLNFQRELFTSQMAGRLRSVSPGESLRTARSVWSASDSSVLSNGGNLGKVDDLRPGKSGAQAHAVQTLRAVSWFLVVPSWFPNSPFVLLSNRGKKQKISSTTLH